MDDPTKPQDSNPNPPMPAPQPPIEPSSPAPTPMPADPPAQPPADPGLQSTLPPITHAHTFTGGKFLFAGAGIVVVLLLAATVLLVSQQSYKQATQQDTSAKVNYTPPASQPLPTPTIEPGSPADVNSIDVGTGTEGVQDIQNDVSGL